MVEMKEDGRLKLMQFVACLYDNIWWIGLITKIDFELNNIEIDFIHLHGPNKFFSLTKTSQHLLCSIKVNNYVY